MEDDIEVISKLKTNFGISSFFIWHLHNPFLPVETKEATFCFSNYTVSLWKVTLRRLQARRTAYYWPVSLSLIYLPPDGAGENESLKTLISVHFVEVGNEPPRKELFVFNGNNGYTYTYNSSIRPVHGRLEIEINITIIGKGHEIIMKESIMTKNKASDLLKDLSKDLKRLWTENLCTDMVVQSRDESFPVHSYILRYRWPHFYSGHRVVLDRENPQTVNTDIPPHVLKDILTYLYTGYIEHFPLHDPSYEEYRTELFHTMDRYPLCHLYMMMIQSKLHAHGRITTTDISSSAMTFRVEKFRSLDCYAWTHSPLPGVSVKTSLRLDLDFHKTLSYTLRFTNPMQLSARVCLEYRRKVIGWDSDMRRIVYECDHEISSNGAVVTVSDVLMERILYYLENSLYGHDRRERCFEVEHSLRFILYLSRGEKCIKLWVKNSTREKLSFKILSKHMSQIRSRSMQANLLASSSDQNSRPHRLHKEIFLVRIPGWRNVIKEDPDAIDSDDGVTCKVDSETFNFVLEYLYTGKCLPTRWYLVLKIREFAKQGGISSLENYINKYSNLHRRNQIYPFVADIDSDSDSD